MLNRADLKNVRPIFWRLLFVAAAAYVMGVSITQSIIIRKVIALEHEMQHITDEKSGQCFIKQ